MGSFKTYVGNEPPHIQGAPVVTNFWFWNLHVAVGQYNRYINHIYKVIPSVIELKMAFRVLSYSTSISQLCENTFVMRSC